MTDRRSIDLVKIGPGLGRRSKIWSIVKKKLCVKSKHSQILSLDEHSILDRLTEGTNWMELVPAEWKETYGLVFDAAGSREPIATKTRDQIVRDVPRTFSLYIEHARYLRLHFPNDIKPYIEALQALLEVVCHQSFGRGYCQGMNFLAATFLLSEGNQRSAFILMSYLLKQCHLEILYNPKCSSLLEYMEYYEKRLETHNPIVFQHLQNEEFPPLCYTVEWFTTCFLVSSPGELSACVIDLILCGYDDIMIRVGLALMDHLETVILHSNAEKLQLNFKKMLLLANCVEVMTKSLTIPNDNIEGVSRIQFMKLNCATMDPNVEWVNTMQICKVHEADNSSPPVTDGGEVSNSEPDGTSHDTCTCSSSTLPLQDSSHRETDADVGGNASSASEEAASNSTYLRPNSVDIGVLYHSHGGRSSHMHALALLRAHAQSSPPPPLGGTMEAFTINEQYVQDALGLMGLGDDVQKEHEQEQEQEQEHSSVDSPAAPASSSAASSSMPSRSKGVSNISTNRNSSHIIESGSPDEGATSVGKDSKGTGYHDSNNSPIIQRSRSVVDFTDHPSASTNTSTKSSTKTSTSTSTPTTSPSTSSTAKKSNRTSNGTSSSSGRKSSSVKDSAKKKEPRPSSASMVSSAFRALYK